MVALRLTRGAHPAVHLRRLLVAAASGGTGFLLLCTLGYALAHPGASPAALLLRLAWCVVPLAATVWFALAVARTDPATRPRPGLSAVGLGPARLMAVSALTTALSTTLGSTLALLVFLHLRGDLTGMPFDGAASEFLAADQPLPVPAALTLLAVLPATASAAVALTHRPRDPHRPHTPHRYGRFGAYSRTVVRETFGAYGRFGTHLGAKERHPGAGPTSADGSQPLVQSARNLVTTPTPSDADHQAAGGLVTASAPAPADAAHQPAESAGSRAAGAARVGAAGTPQAPGSATDPHTATDGTPEPPAAPTNRTTDPEPTPTTTLPWGITLLAAGLATEAYALRTGAAKTLLMPSGMRTGSVAVLLGWLLTAVGLALAGPGLTHLTGRLLQAARPGALRLLAGRVLMAEATRIGRPLGVVCAVASAAFATTALRGTGQAEFGPLTTLGALVVAGCTVATLLTAAVEARQQRADTTAALLRLGAPATMLRSAALLRTAALLAVFAPLTLLVAELAALPLTH
ncbi:hypothetical protein C3489_11885 [Streptomyces sp. Ru71]|uniref:hypothetical protein n=1 Tax=Streptomyces sp. Ru71 TaxID=2080746 RepID=UPI000CDD7537|nr:hypothetical protein [Streptomyces sp. Ru71]POX55243.1 hypothetical protein C3489_11885 [Streptomyces sp. Ru71]